MTSPNNTPQATELLPCPFCGSAPVLVEHESHAHSAMLKALVPGLPDHPGSWSIECCDVGMIKATHEEVVTAWNRRTISGVLEPVTGDLLPPVGTQVLIHLNRQDAWVEHTVSGYYVWGALSHQVKEGEKNAHRVFVRVKDAKGYDNARLLSEVRPTVQNAGDQA